MHAFFCSRTRTRPLSPPVLENTVVQLASQPLALPYVVVSPFAVVMAFPSDTSLCMHGSLWLHCVVLAQVGGASMIQSNGQMESRARARSRP